MPKDKEKKFNPVAAQHKADKARQIKKGKAAAAAQRTERLAKKNPYHLERQLDALKEAKERGELDARHLPRIEGLEKEIRAIRKAREELGIKDEPRERRPRDGKVLGKRRRDGEREEESSQTDEDARDIPMPQDEENEPPIPRRKNKRPANGEQRGPHPLPEKPPAVESKAIYEAQPILRDLHKEAARAFIPKAVQEKMKKAKGQAGLLEPEELDRLEKAGYGGGKEVVEAEKVVDEAEKEVVHKAMANDDPDAAIDEEMKRFEEEIGVLDDTKTMREEAMEDARRAADEAEKEGVHTMMEVEAKEDLKNNSGPTVKKMAASLPGLVDYSDSEDDEDEANDVEKEAEKAADAAEQEAEFSMMADEEFDEFGNPVSQAKKVEQHLRRVEIEEVPDEDL